MRSFSRRTNWRSSAHKLGLNFVNEIEQQIFRLTLLAGKFLPAEQCLVKLTPEVCMCVRTFLEGDNV